MVKMWGARRRLWNRIATLKFAGAKVVDIRVPDGGGAHVRAVPLSTRFPGIGIHEVLVADRIPTGEGDARAERFYRLMARLFRVFSPNVPGLPSIDADRRAALGAAYTDRHRALFPAPEFPDEFRDLDLGLMATTGPYAHYVTATGPDTYEWDLRALGDYDVHDGLVRLGVHVRFVQEGTRLRATEIASALGTVVPGDTDWDRSVGLALCAATTHTSLIRHYNWVHLIPGAAFAIATRSALPADHPLTRLLWPHIYRTEFSNWVTTVGQLSPGGDFEEIFSFTRESLLRLFDDTCRSFDATVVDPWADADRRGIVGRGLDLPVLENSLAHHDVMRAHAERYLRAYYADDAALAADADVQRWFAELDHLIPNGAEPLGGTTTLESASRLIGSLIHLVAYQHEAYGTLLWNYQLWTQVQPIRVRADGAPEPVDVYQRLVNADFGLNIRRSPMMQDFAFLALDGRGRAAFRAYLSDLLALQTRLEAEPHALYNVYPDMLEANMNG
ncbi:lipoxygenase family protein [Microbacter sp. GSS18]|nr:lipoxygenase family protein [Microbacter sp. GSS18]